MRDKIDQEFKAAMRSKDENTVSALRNVKAEIKNVEIDKKRPLTDEEVLEVIAKKVKQHRDSIESFRSGGREDLVAHEERQMGILMQYMPQQMSEDEVRGITKEIVASLGATAKDFGRVMKEVMAKCKGRVDGSVVSKIVKEILG